jgi:MFS family permease
VGLDVFHVLLLWTCSWVGGSLAARRLGHLTECHGERAVLVLCLAFKPALMLGLLAVPRNPAIAFWCLAPAFALDQVLNAGIEIANNGFMLKRSPRENRTMFIAAGTAFAGTVGGLTAVAAGAVLGATTSWSIQWQGATLVNFHALFALSVVLRIAAALLATRLHDSQSIGPAQLIYDLLRLGASKPPRTASQPALRLDAAHVTMTGVGVESGPAARGGRRTASERNAA